MTLEELEAKVQNLEDVEAVKKLQISYSYYLEHWEEEQLIDLFSQSPDVSIQTCAGPIYQGPEAVRKFFHFADHYHALGTVKPPPTFLHRLISISGIVDVAPDPTGWLIPWPRLLPEYPSLISTMVTLSRYTLGQTTKLYLSF